MLLSSTARHQWLPALGASLPLIILFVTALSIPLATAQELGLSPGQTTSWILVLWGFPGLLSLVFVMLYRQPIVFTGNIFAIIFVASLGDQIAYPELIGAFIVAGISMLLITALGLTGRLAALIPTPVMFGLLAGAVMPFVSDVFTFLGEAPVLVGGTFLAYLWGRYSGSRQIPAILPALGVGLLLTALTGQFGAMPEGLPLPAPVFTTPVFSLPAIVSTTPVIIILMTIQSNLPSLVYLRSQGYHPPERLINNIGGVSTMAGSLFGPATISVSLPATSLVAGPLAGDRDLRYRSAYLAGGALVVIGLLAGVAADLPAIIPLSLLFTLAGLSVIDILSSALQQVTRGPLVLGPLLAFAIALSEISLFGLGPFFWSLVIGTGVSMLLEGDALQKLRAPAAPETQADVVEVEP